MYIIVLVDYTDSIQLQYLKLYLNRDIYLCSDYVLIMKRLIKYKKKSLKKAYLHKNYSSIYIIVIYRVYNVHCTVYNVYYGKQIYYII